MTSDDLTRLLALLEKHESRRPLVYDDATGKTLVPGMTLVGNPTVGIGRNLTGKGLTNSEIDFLCKNDVAETVVALAKEFPWFPGLDGARQAAIVDFAFNVGAAGLHRSPKMLAALAAGDFPRAAAELLDGPWATQVGPTRSDDLKTLIVNGAFA